MKIETILNAFEIVIRKPGKWDYRKYIAFRTRILRMDAEKDDVIEGQFKAIERQHETIVQLRNEIGTWEEIDEMMFGEAQNDSPNN